MAINPDIRDHAYQFFIEEAPELLQTIESGILTLAEERSTAKVHNLMRAAHSLKGGSSSVGLAAITTLSHRLENIFKALYNDALEVDSELEDRLLQAYDCLRLPLMEQIQTGCFNAETALAIADPIFRWIEERCGEALTQAESYMPSSAELGVDMLSSIFEVDVAQGLERLQEVMAHPQHYEVAGELRAQTEVFLGFAEFLNLSPVETIAKTVLQALNARPDRALELTRLALADFESSRQAILAGDRRGGTGPSAALIAFTDAVNQSQPNTELSLDLGEFTRESGELNNVDSDSFPDIFFDFANLEIDDTGHPFPEKPDDVEIASQGIADITADIADCLQALDGEWHESDHDPELSWADDLDWNNDLDWDEDLDWNEEDWLNDFTIGDDATIELNPNRIAQPSQLNEQKIKFDSDAADFILTKPISEVSFEVEPLPQFAQQTGDRISSFSDQTPQRLSFYKEAPAVKEFTTIEATVVSDVVSEVGGLVRANPSVEITHQPPEVIEVERSTDPSSSPKRVVSRPAQGAIASKLTVRVDSERLERMNNLVGELAINRDGLSLQNEQLQGALRQLLNRFERFQTMVGQLRDASDQLLVAPEHRGNQRRTSSKSGSKPPDSKKGVAIRSNTGSDSLTSFGLNTEFDPLEMDRYGAVHLQLQEIFEDMVQLEETVEDIKLFATQSDQMLTQQQQMLANLQDDLIQARMLPLSEVLNRFPRTLRDLSSMYRKPVNLNLIGTGVLVDRAILERLYDPLLHLLRNAFDHGIEPSSMRQKRGKPPQGQIEIRAYHKGNQTIIEIKDDGQGIHLDNIRRRAYELGWLSVDELRAATPAQLFELIFEPGFSTARQVSELSGRGVGLDVVRSQLRSVKGKISVQSTPGEGTTFTLALPLTLTIVKLVICLVGSRTLALSADSVEEIVTPQAEQIRQSGAQQFLYWRDHIIPTYRLADLLDYAYPLPETAPSKALGIIPLPKNWAQPMLILRQDQQRFALEISTVVTEQELVIKPFGSAIAPPSYMYGCTILGDGSLVPVLDGAALLAIALKQMRTQRAAIAQAEPVDPIHAWDAPPTKALPAAKAVQTPTILVVDDSVTLRRTLALSLERIGCRVLQARDGREAIEQLQQSPCTQLIICDIEMPGMNGFEFLNHRRQTPEFATIPVVMLTSRSNEKHNWLATRLGATAYFTKPYLEQEFFAAVKDILTSG